MPVYRDPDTILKFDKVSWFGAPLPPIGGLDNNVPSRDLKPEFIGVRAQHPPTQGFQRHLFERPR